MSEEQPVVSPVAKPGYKTTEFWLSLAAVVVSALLGSGVLHDGGQWTQIVGVAATVLTALGYTVSRTLAKK